MQFGLAFSYPFQDSEWFKKIALVGLISLIPIVGWLYMVGWMLDVMARVMRNDPQPLPAEIDFGTYIGKGFQGFVIGFVYAIPMIIFSLPTSVVQFLPELVDIDPDTMGIISIVVGLCCGGLSFVYGILMGLMIPAAYGHFISQGSLGAAFQVGAVFGLVKSAIGPYFLVLLGGLLASIVGQLGVIACIIGLLVTLPYSMAVNAHLYGQAYNVATSNKAL